MSISTTIPETVEIRRSRLLGLVAGVAAVAAAITWALTAYAVGDMGQQSVSAPVVSSSIPSPGHPAAISAPRANALSSLSPQEQSYLKAMTAVCSVVMCPPNERLAARLGIGSVSAPTTANALSSLSPQERRYVRAMTAVCSVIMCQPDERLAARLGIGTHG